MDSTNRNHSLSDPITAALLPPPNESVVDREKRLRAEEEAKKISDEWATPLSFLGVRIGVEVCKSGYPFIANDVRILVYLVSFSSQRHAASWSSSSSRDKVRHVLRNLIVKDHQRCAGSPGMESSTLCVSESFLLFCVSRG